MDIRFRRTIFNYTSKNVLLKDVCMLRQRSFREFEVITFRHYVTPIEVISADSAKDFNEKSESIYIADNDTIMDVLSVKPIESVYILDDAEEDKANDCYVANVLKKVGTYTRVKYRFLSILNVFKAKNNREVLVGSAFNEV